MGEVVGGPVVPPEDVYAQVFSWGEGQARLVVGLREGLTATEVAEIFAALTRLYTALANEPARDPILKVGLPNPVGSDFEFARR